MGETPKKDQSSLSDSESEFSTKETEEISDPEEEAEWILGGFLAEDFPEWADDGNTLGEIKE
jgi:hypothetical protein